MMIGDGSRNPATSWIGSNHLEAFSEIENPWKIYKILEKYLQKNWFFSLVAGSGPLILFEIESFTDIFSGIFLKFYNASH